MPKPMTELAKQDVDVYHQLQNRQWFASLLSRPLDPIPLC